MSCHKAQPREIAASCAVVFLALPHTVAMEYAPSLLKLGVKVIDLSADYRINDPAVYERHYQIPHKDAARLKHAVYGLPELYRADIASATLVANPGCYPTCAILALAPFLSCGAVDRTHIIIDAKSGISGAGKKITRDLLFGEAHEDFRAYKVNAHQHIPEIVQVLARLAGGDVGVTFVPHLLPLNRGILETIYVTKQKGTDLQGLMSAFYKTEPFVRVRPQGEFPRIKDVVYTNYCDIGVRDEGTRAIIIAAIDNLRKGASGQAVQNMNIMFGFPEHLGLR
jgi:N-acetyl-gamma-glutamyl-phosphate reductase